MSFGTVVTLIKNFWPKIFSQFCQNIFQIFFFTMVYLVSTKFYHISLSFTSSSTKYSQIPVRFCPGTQEMHPQPPVPHPPMAYGTVASIATQTGGSQGHRSAPLVRGLGLMALSGLPPKMKFPLGCGESHSRSPAVPSSLNAVLGCRLRAIAAESVCLAQLTLPPPQGP